MGLDSYRMLGVLLFVIPSFVTAQGVLLHKQVDIDWAVRSIELTPDAGQKTSVWYSKQTVYDKLRPETPSYLEVIDLPSEALVDVTVTVLSKTPVDFPTSIGAITSPVPEVEVDYRDQRRVQQALVSVFPFVQLEGLNYRVDAFELVVKSRPIQTVQYRAPPKASRSVLADGQVYKIAVPKTGIYKMTASFLAELGLSTSDVDIRNLHVYGHGGVVPERLADDRFDDLVENAVYVSGQSDGRLDGTDAIYFYAEGPDRWEVGRTEVAWRENPYSDQSYYFLKIDASPGLRVQAASELPPADRVTSTYTRRQRYEVDQTNLLGKFGLAEGTGQEWYGDYFNSTRARSYGHLFNFADIAVDQPVRLRSEIAVRSKTSSRVEYNLDGEVSSFSVGSVGSSSTSDYARIVRMDKEIMADDADITIDINYPSNGTTSEAWLNYIETTSHHRLTWSSDYNEFYSESLLDDVVAYDGAADAGYQVWDVTSRVTPELLATDLRLTTDRPRKLIAWRESGAFAQPTAIGLVPTQDLHGLTEVDMVVVYHKSFKAAVDRWIEHRSLESGLLIEAVDIDHVSNEFASGQKDPGAIRDFAKMLYDRSDRFRYCLLFGDASYDYRQLDPLLDDQNFVPVYQTPTSINAVGDFPTDDFYALLSDNEGGDLVGALDIAVGRLPVKTLAEANNVVDKIIEYDGLTLGDWRIRQTWVADDEDNSTHFVQSERIAKQTERLYPAHNSSKIYLDAYEQVSTPGGERYPDATAQMNQNFFRGHLMINYLGHGGPNGWAQERVLQLNDIQQWNNKGKYPLMITATCTFTGFDDPEVVSGGEASFLRKDAGVIALFTTVRPVFAQDNERLVAAVVDTLYTKVDGQAQRFGDIITIAKNTNKTDTLRDNARKFVLIGDPAQRLSLPSQEIIISTINGQPVEEVTDPIGALEEVVISGRVVDAMGNTLKGFNGVVFPTVFDKPTTLQLLGNDSGSAPGSFEVFSNIVFKGQATVESGEFTFRFVVPSDINYEVGKGKISLYAHDGMTDASGVNTSIVIGGGGRASDDNEGPQIELYMNDFDFKDGGVTGTDPILLARLSDDIGINVTGNSIGHDLTAILDGDRRNAFVLNDFYQSANNDFTTGLVTFPLEGLTLGEHTIVVKAWDSNNNSSEAAITFVVVDDGSRKIFSTVNYPNPFVDQTRIAFEHNIQGYEADIDITFFDTAGRHVGQLAYSKLLTGNREVTPMIGGADIPGSIFSGNFGSGILIYKINVTVQQLGNLTLTKSGKMLGAE